jgi:hypothetical protein
MASAAYVLAPMAPIPEERDPRWFAAVASFLAVTTRVWSELRGALPEAEQERVPRFMGGVGLSTNMADATATKDEAIVAAARAFTEAAWRRYDEGGRRDLPVADAAAFARATGVASRVALDDLVAHRAGWKTRPAKTGGGALVGSVRLDARLDAFGLLEADSTDRAALAEIVRAYGGAAVALFSFGHAAHALVARSPAPGGEVAWHGPFSFRLARPRGGRGPALEGLGRALERSAIPVDLAMIARELEAPVASLRAIFAAFGVPGVDEIAPVDGPARWAAFEAVARALFRGDKPDAKARKAVNDALGDRPDDEKLPASAKLGKGALARTYAGAAWAMRQAVAPPEGSPAAPRRAAVERAWDVLDGDAAGRLTVGVDKKRLGETASLGRLLACFPPSLARDPLFLAELAIKLEAANAHAWVDGLAALAETVASTGLVAIAVPRGERDALRKALGVAPGEEPIEPPPGPWHAEAVLAGPAFPKADAAGAARAFAAKRRCGLVIAELGADGAVALEHLGAAGDLGLATDRDALGAAARALDVRAVFPALGVGDLLDPGPIDEGSYRGGGVRGSAWQRELGAKATAALARPAEAIAIASAGELVARLGDTLRGPERACVAIRLEVDEPEDGLRALRLDLGLAGVGSANVPLWLEPGAVCGCLASRVDVATLAAVLADLPHARLAIAAGEARAFRW